MKKRKLQQADERTIALRTIEGITKRYIYWIKDNSEGELKKYPFSSIREEFALKVFQSPKTFLTFRDKLSKKMAEDEKLKFAKDLTSYYNEPKKGLWTNIGRLNNAYINPKTFKMSTHVCKLCLSNRMPFSESVLDVLFIESKKGQIYPVPSNAARHMREVHETKDGNVVQKEKEVHETLLNLHKNEAGKTRERKRKKTKKDTKKTTKRDTKNVPSPSGSIKIHQQLLKPIKAIFLDIDGVLTDGSILVLGDGSQVRTFNVKDGWAIKRCIEVGLKVVIISAGKDQSVIKRFVHLGLKKKDINIGVKAKRDLFKKYLKRFKLNLKECLYMGDDMSDYDIMKLPGVLSVCPADACNDIARISNFKTARNGGKGAVRDILETLLKSQGKWPELY